MKILKIIREMVNFFVPKLCWLVMSILLCLQTKEDKILTNGAAPIQAVKDNIGSAIDEIQLLVCENIIKIFITRITISKKTRGGYLGDFGCLD